MTSINERLEALAARHGVDEMLEDRGQSISDPMPIEFGNKRNVKMGAKGFLLQRFPVTLYAPSLLRFLREENIEALVRFLEDNEDSLSWGREE